MAWTLHVPNKFRRWRWVENIQIEEEGRKKLRQSWLCWDSGRMQTYNLNFTPKATARMVRRMRWSKEREGWAPEERVGPPQPQGPDAMEAWGSPLETLASTPISVELGGKSNFTPQRTQYPFPWKVQSRRLFIPRRWLSRGQLLALYSCGEWQTSQCSVCTQCFRPGGP